MRIDVLGPLRVSDDRGGSVGVVGMPLKVLAVLACEPNRPVSVDRLADQVWPAKQPKDPRNNLQVYVHKLRRLLSQERVARVSGGYLLSLDDDELDARSFEVLVAEGHQTRGTDAQKAASLYAEGLELWRGQPYDGLDIDVAAREATRLQELRLTALDAWFDTRLELGHHMEALTGLHEAVGEHRFHDGLRAHLMVALYRGGRAAEALQVYREGREALRDELGLDPSPRLRAIEAQILADDPALSSRPAGPATVSAPPAELPPRSHSFVGRETEIEKLIGEIADGPPVVAVAGPGGIGKSALITQVAHLTAQQFPDGQLYVDLHGATPGMSPVQPLDVLARFLRSLGEDPSGLNDVDEAASRLRSVTARSRLLVLLDNAASAEQVRPLLPSGHGTVLVTSRQVLATLDNATHLQLGPFGESVSVALLSRQIGPDRADPAGTAELAQLCDHWPLALRIAAARLVASPELSPARLAERLRTRQGRLDELEYADLGVRSSLAISIDALTASADKEAVALFSAISVLDLPFVTGPLAAVLVDRSEREASALLEVLARAQLVSGASDGTYRMHDLVRLVAREESELVLDPVEAAVRAARYYLASARAVLRAVHAEPDAICARGATPAEVDVAVADFESPLAALEFMDQHAVNLVSITELAAGTGRLGDRLATGLAAALIRPLLRRTLLAESVAVTRVGVWAARATGERAWLAAAHVAAGYALQISGRGTYRQVCADHEAAIEGYRSIGDLAGEAIGLNVLGIAQLGAGENLAAREMFIAAIAALDKAGADNATVARWPVLQSFGSACLRLQQYDDARGAFEGALADVRARGDRLGEAKVLHNFGELMLKLDPRAATGLFRASIDLAREGGDRQAEAAGLWHLSTAMRLLGQFSQAQESRRLAVGSFQALGRLNLDQVRELLADPDLDAPTGLLDGG